MTNIDRRVVADFGAQWHAFDQMKLSLPELQSIFEGYFRIFPWHQLCDDAKGFDLGCGSGRWAKLVSPRVGTLYCIDPSEAIAVAKRNLDSHPNCRFIQASVDAIPLEDDSLDFGYSLGVLHHVPDTQAAINSCVEKLKPGAPFLLYLYYAFDNKPFWFRLIWYAGDVVRRTISKLPRRIRYWSTQLIALCVYYPCARVALLLERFGVNIDHVPLSQYRYRGLYVMRTDAYDRFATRLEQRFTRKQIAAMLERCNLEDIQFSDGAPYWCVVGRKRIRIVVGPSCVE